MSFIFKQIQTKVNKIKHEEKKPSTEPSKINLVKHDKTELTRLEPSKVDSRVNKQKICA